MPERSNTSKLSARALAKVLKRHPVPHLSISDLGLRWSCSRSTVERHRLTFSLKTAGHKDAHPEYSLFDILRIEGVADPEGKWIVGTDVDREIFSAPLLTINDLVQLDPKIKRRSSETFRARARTAARTQGHGDIARDRESIRLGHAWLFRPIEADLPYLHATKLNGGMEI
nr:hypothetical protein [uncultured Cohaesibacter sp.]